MRMFKYSFYKQEILQLDVNNFYVNELDRVHQIIYRYEKRVSKDISACIVKKCLRDVAITRKP